MSRQATVLEKLNRRKRPPLSKLAALKFSIRFSVSPVQLATWLWSVCVERRLTVTRTARMLAAGKAAMSGVHVIPAKDI